MVRPTRNQRRWLLRGVDRPAGRLPLFDDDGQRISPSTMRSCMEHGWVKPDERSPAGPRWQICRLTEDGKEQISKPTGSSAD